MILSIFYHPHFMSNIIFNSDNFTVSDNKILSFNSRELFKIPKNLFGVVQNDTDYFLLDRGGDCFKISKEILLSANSTNNPKQISDDSTNKIQSIDVSAYIFVCGIYVLPSSFHYENNLLIIEDTYKRTFNFNTEGKLIKVDFKKEKKL